MKYGFYLLLVFRTLLKHAAFIVVRENIIDSTCTPSSRNYPVGTCDMFSAGLSVTEPVKQTQAVHCVDRNKSHNCEQNYSHSLGNLRTSAEALQPHV